jgi:hypothetical protein
VSGRTVHVSLSTRGALRHFVEREWRNVVSRDDGTYLTPAEVKEYLLCELAEGHEAIPYGEPCEGFSFKTGCPGHPSLEPVRPCRSCGKADARGLTPCLACFECCEAEHGKGARHEAVLA